MPIFRMKPKQGKHYLRRGGQRIVLRPGDEIECEKHELGGAIRKFEQITPDPPPPQPEAGLKAQPREDEGFDVINEASGKPVNDQPLSKAEAEGLTGEKIEDSSPEESPAETEPEEAPGAEGDDWEAQARGDGTYDVIDKKTGRQVNRSPFDKESAEAVTGKKIDESPSETSVVETEPQEPLDNPEAAPESEPDVEPSPDEKAEKRSKKTLPRSLRKKGRHRG